MKSPTQNMFTLPARFTHDEQPYTHDWTDLLEDDEEIVAVNIVMSRGDTIIDRIDNDGAVMTYWLTGGTTKVDVHEMRAWCSTTKQEVGGSTIIRIPVLV